MADYLDGSQTSFGNTIVQNIELLHFTPVQDAPIERAVFRPHEAARYLGISETKLNQLTKAPGGPITVRLATRCLGYRKTDLDAFVESRIER